MERPVLVTLTSPTAAGKSYLFNYIRDEAKLPCLISTTTRAPRAGEKEGIDYFFISEEESKRLEAADEFAELAIYGGVRYGVTKNEFLGKLVQNGLAFLIVEPSGIDHYVEPALKVGAIHLKYFLYTDPLVRHARFTARVRKDIIEVLNKRTHDGNIVISESEKHLNVLQVVESHMKRMKSMMTHELDWGTKTQWTRTLMGEKHPSENVEIILKDVAKAKALEDEIDRDATRRSVQGTLAAVMATGYQYEVRY